MAGIHDHCPLHRLHWPWRGLSQLAPGVRHLTNGSRTLCSAVPTGSYADEVAFRCGGDQRLPWAGNRHSPITMVVSNNDARMPLLQKSIELHRSLKLKHFYEQWNLLLITVRSRKVIGLFSEQLGFEFVPVLHRLQGGFAAQG